MIIKESFNITGRGVMVVISADNSFGWGDTVTIERPDGTEIESKIVGIESSSPNFSRLIAVNIRLKDCSEAPAGSNMRFKSAPKVRSKNLEWFD